VLCKRSNLKAYVLNGCYQKRRFGCRESGTWNFTFNFSGSSAGKKFVLRPSRTEMEEWEGGTKGTVKIFFLSRIHRTKATNT
jgi:hypothetical protein